MQTLTPRERKTTPRAASRERIPRDPVEGEIVVFADGAARGNPGPAAIGALLTDSTGQLVEAVSEAIGVATNNQAEYRALIAGLEAAARRGARIVRIRMDSELVVKQLCGEYQVRHPGLKPLHERVRELFKHFPKVTIRHVPRAQNRKADALANAALDGRTVEEALRI